MQNAIGRLDFQSEFQRTIRRKLRAPLRSHKARELSRVDGGILTKLHGDQLTLALDLNHPDIEAQQLQRGIAKKVAHRIRRLAVAVF